MHVSYLYSMLSSFSSDKRWYLTIPISLKVSLLWNHLTIWLSVERKSGEHGGRKRRRRSEKRSLLRSMQYHLSKIRSSNSLWKCSLQSACVTNLGPLMENLPSNTTSLQRLCRRSHHRELDCYQAKIVRQFRSLKRNSNGRRRTAHRITWSF